MKRFIKFPSIEQFRNIVTSVKSKATFKGLDENGEPIFDKSLPFPKVNAIASEKIHGTNAAVCYNDELGFWVQSRKNIITPEKDNAGCAFWAEQNKDVWIDVIKKLSEEHNIDLNENIVSVYFEWAGGNIQKKSALTGLDKRAMLFQHFKISPKDPEKDEVSIWKETKVKDAFVDNVDNNIFNIMNFPTYNIEIDFERPDIAQNELVELVEKTIEPNSPVGRQFGIDGNVGEGVVVTFWYKDNLYRFKVKGEKHANSKVKKLKKVDSEKEEKKRDFANYATPVWRLEQAFQELYGIENEKGEPNIKDTGDFIRLVIKDVIKEESDVLAEKKLEPRDVNPLISKICANWFKEELDRQAGL